MPGERFTTLYVRPERPTPDSSRARHRVGTLFRETVFNGHAERLAEYFAQELGIPVPGDGRHSSDWQQLIRDFPTPEFLDTVTLVYRYLFYHAGDAVADRWRDAVKKIFAEENLAYEIDEVGGVHPAVDSEFQRNRASTVAALRSDRHDNVRELFEGVAKYLNADPPNYMKAWRAMFSSLEALFALMFPYVRLTAEDVERRLRPVAQRAYDGDAAAQKAVQSMVAALREWVEASDIYRHQPGAEEPAEPPADVAILAISSGASLLRWLAGLDADRTADRAA